MNEADLEVNAEQIVSGNPEKQPSSLGKYRSQLESGKMSHCKYNECMRSLNKEQRAVVKYHRAWCKKTVAILNSGTGHQVNPYYLFLSGPGGAGKSFVIKMPCTDTLNHFCRVHEIPGDEVASLLTATTGVAAHNVGGITMHSAFALSDHGRQQRDNRGHIPGEYMELSSTILNTMHTQLENSYVVIIDEVSMMSAHMLYSMHYHLQEIIRYSMLILDLAMCESLRLGTCTSCQHALGRRYLKDLVAPTIQLNSPCYMTRYGKTTWIQWTDSSCQTEWQCICTSSQPCANKHTSDDVKVLESCQITFSDPLHFDDALHVFATNRQADKFNSEKIASLTREIFNCISKKDKETSQVHVSTKSKKRSDTGGLVETLYIAEGATVKLTWNLDLGDGLVNGVCGVVQKITTKPGTGRKSLWCLTVTLWELVPEGQADIGKTIPMLSQFIDILQHLKLEEHHTCTANYLSSWPGHVLHTQFKDSLLTRLQLTGLECLLLDKLM